MENLIQEHCSSCRACEQNLQKSPASGDLTSAVVYAVSPFISVKSNVGPQVWMIELEFIHYPSRYSYLSAPSLSENKSLSIPNRVLLHQETLRSLREADFSEWAATKAFWKLRLEAHWLIDLIPSWNQCHIEHMLGDWMGTLSFFNRRFRALQEMSMLRCWLRGIWWSQKTWARGKRRIVPMGGSSYVQTLKKEKMMLADYRR